MASTTAPLSEQPARVGKALREKVPYSAQAVWKAPENRDPLGPLRASDRERIPNLIPIRYGRMLQSPFAFYRGSAAVMAADLATTASTGITVQCCGDCHLANFGGFATPERNVVFDLNDFDETLPAPWEWDLKRLAASFVLAARSNGLSGDAGESAAAVCARSYRKRLRKYADMHPLDLWYARITTEDAMQLMPEQAGALRRRVSKASAARGSELDYPKLTTVAAGRVRIVDNPPLIFHPTDAKDSDYTDIIKNALDTYRETLTEDRRALLDRYRYIDAAIKVVGVGSVGTRCWIVLLMSSSNDPLFLQFKEAHDSVLEPYAGKSAYPHHGQRVVMGQRLLQAASDMFLGWTTGRAGPQYYARQLRDAKIKPLIETFDAGLLEGYAKLCGWALARAHAKAGGAPSISDYLDGKGAFDDAMAEFALAYADQAERDHAALQAAVRAGEIEAVIED